MSPDDCLSLVLEVDLKPFTIAWAGSFCLSALGAARLGLVALQASTSTRLARKTGAAGIDHSGILWRFMD